MFPIFSKNSGIENTVKFALFVMIFQVTQPKDETIYHNHSLTTKQFIMRYQASDGNCWHRCVLCE